MVRSRLLAPLLVWAALVGGILENSLAQARDLFVDNLLGDDTFSGATDQPTGGTAGPFRSIQAALKRARPSDTIHLAARETPYFETIDLAGPRLSNGGQGGLTIEGHGAVISGVFAIPSGAWKYLGNELWQVRPLRKAHYQVVNYDQAVPEVLVQPLAGELPVMPPGTWSAWRGVIYYKAEDRGWASPDQLPLGLAAKDVGVSIYDVNNVVIRDLTLRHFRLDGVNAHDRARGIVLENVKLLENGRSGLAVGGSSRVRLVGGELRNNRLAEVWNSELGRTEIERSQVVPGRRGLAYQVTGGQVVVDGTLVVEPRP